MATSRLWKHRPPGEDGDARADGALPMCSPGVATATVRTRDRKWHLSLQEAISRGSARGDCPERLARHYRGPPPPPTGQLWPGGSSRRRSRWLCPLAVCTTGAPGHLYWGFLSLTSCPLPRLPVSLSLSLLMGRMGPRVAVTLSTVVRVVADGPLGAPCTPPSRTHARSTEAAGLPVPGGGLLKTSSLLATSCPRERMRPRFLHVLRTPGGFPVSLVVLTSVLCRAGSWCVMQKSGWF